MKEKLQKKETGFAQVKNSVLFDPKLSFKSKGMFAYLYAKPDDWDFSGERIIKETKDGRKSVYSALQELEACGYLERRKESNGRMTYVISYTKPVDQKGEKPVAQKGKQPKRQTAEKGSISNIVNTDEYSLDTNTPATVPVADAQDPILEEINKGIPLIIEKFKNISPSLNYWNKTQRQACEEMIRRYGVDGTLSMVDRVLSVQGEKYAPRATTPYAMWLKIGDIAVYFKGKNNLSLISV